MISKKCNKCLKRKRLEKKAQCSVCYRKYSKELYDKNYSTASRYPKYFTRPKRKFTGPIDIKGKSHVSLPVKGCVCWRCKQVRNYKLILPS